jgi:hypothetical protein
MKPVRSTVVVVAASLVVLGGAVITEQAVADARATGGSDPSATVKSAGPTTSALAITPTFTPSPAQSVYVPISPCRVVNTVASHHPIPNGVTRGFLVRGAVSLAGQGGSATGCGIPASATAVTAEITTLHHASKGTLKAWAAGTAQPAAFVASFAANTQETSEATIGLSTPGLVPEVSVKAHGSATDVTVDVTGYYDTQAHLIILADGTVWYGTEHLLNLTHTANSGSYVLTFDRSLVGCNILTSSNDARDVQAVGSWGGSTLNVNTSHESGGVFTAADESFQLYVAC